MSDLVERLRGMVNNEEVNSRQFWANILEAASHIEQQDKRIAELEKILEDKWVCTTCLTQMDARAICKCSQGARQ